MKKFIVSMLACAFLVATIGCGEAKKEDKKPTPTPPVPGKDAPAKP